MICKICIGVVQGVFLLINWYWLFPVFLFFLIVIFCASGRLDDKEARRLVAIHTQYCDQVNYKEHKQLKTPAGSFCGIFTMIACERKRINHSLKDCCWLKLHFKFQFMVGIHILSMS